MVFFLFKHTNLQQALEKVSVQLFTFLFVFPVTDNFKVQYMQFLTYMKTPQYHTNLQQALEKERVQLFTFILQIIFLHTHS